MMGIIPLDNYRNSSRVAHPYTGIYRPSAAVRTAALRVGKLNYIPQTVTGARLPGPSAMTTAAARKSASVFAASFMVSSTDVALPVPRLVGVEVSESLFAALRHRPMVSVMRVEAVINVAVEPVGPMKPRSSSKEHATDEPIRSIVTIGSAVIRRIVEVAVRAHGRHSDTNGNLGGCNAARAYQGNSES
jgi:hypothetical protein